MIPTPVEVVGAGLRLRPLGPEDADLVVAASGTDIPDWTFIPRDLDQQQARGWIERGVQARDSGRAVRFVIEMDGTAIGTVGAQHPFAHDDGIVETFYFVLPEHRGRGAATRALRLLDDWLQENVDGLRRLQLHVIPGNPGSESVATRAGYLREGVATHQIPAVNGHPTRDGIVYGIAVESAGDATTGGVLA